MLSSNLPVLLSSSVAFWYKCSYLFSSSSRLMWLFGKCFLIKLVLPEPGSPAVNPSILLCCRYSFNILVMSFVSSFRFDSCLMFLNFSSSICMISFRIRSSIVVVFSYLLSVLLLNACSLFIWKYSIKCGQSFLFSVLIRYFGMYSFGMIVIKSVSMLIVFCC